MLVAHITQSFTHTHTHTHAHTHTHTHTHILQMYQREREREKADQGAFYPRILRERKGGGKEREKRNRCKIIN